MIRRFPRKPYIRGRQRGHMLEQLALQRGRDLVGRGKRQGLIDADRYVRMQLVADPAGFRVDDLDASNVFGRMMDFIDHAGLDAVEHAGENRPGRLPDDAEDRDA